MRLSMKEFEELVETALDGIPQQFLPYLENTVFVVEESSTEGLMGLYQGAGALHAGEGLPDRITLYKRSHERSSTTVEDLVEELRRTILHEVGHHFGMDGDDLPYSIVQRPARPVPEDVRVAASHHGRKASA